MVERVEGNVGGGIDVSVSRFAGDQSGFAEEVTGSEVGDRFPFAASDVESSLFDDVEPVAGVAEADHAMSGGVGFSAGAAGEFGEGTDRDPVEDAAVGEEFADACGFVGSRVAGDPAEVHFDDSVGDVEDSVVVGDDHDRGTALSRVLLKQADDAASRFFVERGGRFVGEEDFGMMHQSSGDGDALFLAAGKFAGQVVGAVIESDGIEDFEAAGVLDPA